ncbi:MAG TPA: hypothetical protein PLJ44_07275, partial [Victivallales bacterium]|nr:hypothetical protein [Victivallales bacterium]
MRRTEKPKITVIVKTYKQNNNKINNFSFGKNRTVQRSKKNKYQKKHVSKGERKKEFKRLFNDKKQFNLKSSLNTRRREKLKSYALIPVNSLKINQTPNVKIIIMKIKKN